MRGQVSLELFFSVSLFLVLLFWMNHFVGVASGASVAAEIAATRSAVFSLQEIADSACLAQASISFPTPCISVFEPLVVNAFGRLVSIGAVGAPTRCAFEASQLVAYACRSIWCVSWISNGTLRLSEGGCA